MSNNYIYLDNHSSTRCDPEVVAAMVPLLCDVYGNPHSSTHAAGHAAADAMAAGIETIARCLNATASEIVITSGATESNNLALLGHCRNPRNRKRHIVTAVSEHPAVLDPITLLETEGFEVTRLPVDSAGMIDLDQYAKSLRDDTAIVSIMWANNEIGTIAPLAEIVSLAHAKGIPVHTDATQAVGRIEVDLKALPVDLLSCSAHKLYGPKGTGLLYVRREGRLARIKPLFEGGGQQRRIRPGTMNPAGVVGLATAMQRCADLMPAEGDRIAVLRQRMFDGLSNRIPGIKLNGASLQRDVRLAGNLSLMFPQVEGQSLMIAVPDLAVSSGSACSHVDPVPSHVLLAIGLSEHEARSTLRIGVGRFNDEAQIDQAIEWLADAHDQLSRMM